MAGIPVDEAGIDFTSLGVCIPSIPAVSRYSWVALWILSICGWTASFVAVYAFVAIARTDSTTPVPVF